MANPVDGRSQMGNPHAMGPPPRPRRPRRTQRLYGIGLHHPVPDNPLLGGGIIYPESRGHFRPPPTPYVGPQDNDHLNNSRLNSFINYAQMAAATYHPITEGVEEEREDMYAPPRDVQQPAFYQPSVMASSVHNSMGGIPTERSKGQQVVPLYNPHQPASNYYQPPPSFMADGLAQQRGYGYNSMGGVPMERSSGQQGMAPPYNPNVPHSRGGIVSVIPETSYAYSYTFGANSTSSSYSHEYDYAPSPYQPESANPRFGENATSSRYEYRPLYDERESAALLFGANEANAAQSSYGYPSHSSHHPPSHQSESAIPGFGANSSSGGYEHSPPSNGRESAITQSSYGYFYQPTEPVSNNSRMIANPFYQGRGFGNSGYGAEEQESTGERSSKRRKR